MIPAYRLPGKSTVYAFKSEMVETARRLLVKGAVPNRVLRRRKKVAPVAGASVIEDLPIGIGSPAPV
jgi:hypothetical protein